ncbi:MAG TPA: helix-turn-helix domain-containing protein [bacterium]|nr:helix-turn-helix domain-containing protein [bacterium]
MAQTLRDWYRYLERQMHVSLPTGVLDAAAPPRPRETPPDPPSRLREHVVADAGPPQPVGAAGAVAAPVRAGQPPLVPPIPRTALDVVNRADAVRRTLVAGPNQRALPMELGPRARGRGGRRPITESREEIIRRLLDPELSLHEAAAVLNLSKATVRRYTDHGKLPCLRTGGGQRRFRLSALLVFLDDQTQARGATG